MVVDVNDNPVVNGDQWEMLGHVSNIWARGKNWATKVAYDFDVYGEEVLQRIIFKDGYDKWHCILEGFK
jgi:hypothetical protein